VCFKEKREFQKKSSYANTPTYVHGTSPRLSWERSWEGAGSGNADYVPLSPVAQLLPHLFSL